MTTIDLVTVDTSGYLMVADLQDWILNPLPLQEPNVKDEYDTIRLVDSKTGALYAVARLRTEGA